MFIRVKLMIITGMAVCGAMKQKTLLPRDCIVW